MIDKNGVAESDSSAVSLNTDNMPQMHEFDEGWPGAINHL